jgi:DNA-binding transcriptional regulator GbsR (MarR family)
MRPSIKRTQVESSIEDAIDDAYQTLEALQEELSEGVENQREHAGIAATARFATLEETVQILEDVVNAKPDWCSSIDSELSGSMRCIYIQDMSKGVSRAGRRDNATAALDAAASGLREWADEQDALVTVMSGKEEDITEEHKEAIAERDQDTIEEQIQEARDLADTLEEHQNDADSAEFPGMRG